MFAASDEVTRVLVPRPPTYHVSPRALVEREQSGIPYVLLAALSKHGRVSFCDDASPVRC